jgi:hypothetical protein
LTISDHAGIFWSILINVPVGEYLRGDETMARIKIQDLEHTEVLDQRQLKGIFGGSERSGIGGLLSKGKGALDGFIGGNAGGALQSAGQGDWGGAISGLAGSLFGG